MTIDKRICKCKTFWSFRTVLLKSVISAQLREKCTILSGCKLENENYETNHGAEMYSKCYERDHRRNIIGKSVKILLKTWFDLCTKQCDLTNECLNMDWKYLKLFHSRDDKLEISLSDVDFNSLPRYVLLR